MIENDIFLHMLGLAAGGLVCTAAVPRVLSIVQDVGKATGESCMRNSLLIGGNLLWIVYGVLANAPALVAMCSINVALNGAILGAAIHAQRRPT